MIRAPTSYFFLTLRFERVRPLPDALTLLSFEDFSNLIFNYEGNYSRGRFRYTSASNNLCHQQADYAGIRQTYDLLPTVDIDACGHHGDPDHFHTTRSAFVQKTVRRRFAARPQLLVCRTTAAERAGAGLCHRRILCGQR